MAGATNPQLGGVFDPSRDATFAGAVTLAGGSAATGGMLLNAQDVTQTGATGTTATLLSALTPVLVTVTGVSGAGVALPTGAAVPGALYVIKNMTTGVMNVYAVGGTINGTTGTTAVAITATGNKGAMIMCTLAGTWQVVPLPT